MIAFIKEHRDICGVKPICRVLQNARQRSMRIWPLSVIRVWYRIGPGVTPNYALTGSGSGTITCLSTRGLGRFGITLSEVMLVIVVSFFAITTRLGPPILESLRCSLVLAVELTPQMMSAILSATRTTPCPSGRHGQAAFSGGKPWIDHDALHYKSGVPTEEHITLLRAVRPDGSEDGRDLDIAALNAARQHGQANPMDAAVLLAAELSGRSPPDGTTLAEIPYTFSRRRVSVPVTEDKGVHLLTKGVALALLACCNSTQICDIDPVQRTSFEERIKA